MRKEQIDVIFFGDLHFTVDLSIADADPDAGMDEAIEDWVLVEAEGSKEPKVLEFFTGILDGPDFSTDWLDACWNEV